MDDDRLSFNVAALKLKLSSMYLGHIGPGRAEQGTMILQVMLLLLCRRERGDDIGADRFVCAGDGGKVRGLVSE